MAEDAIPSDSTTTGVVVPPIRLFQPTPEDVNNAALYAEYRLREKFKEQSPVGAAFARRGFVRWAEQQGEDLNSPVPYPCIWDLEFQEDDPEKRAQLRKEKCPYGKYVFTKEGCLGVSCRAAVDGVPVSREAFHKEQAEGGGKYTWGEFCYFNEANTGIRNYKHPMDTIAEQDPQLVAENPSLAGTHSVLTWWDEPAGKCRMAPATLALSDHELVLPTSHKYERVYNWFMEDDKDWYGETELLGVRKYIKKGMPLLKYDRPYCEGKVKISFDPDKLVCYRTPGQYIAEEFVFGGVFREFYGYHTDNWRARVPPRLPSE